MSADFIAGTSAHGNSTLTACSSKTLLVCGTIFSSASTMSLRFICASYSVSSATAVSSTVKTSSTATPGGCSASLSHISPSTKYVLYFSLFVSKTSSRCHASSLFFTSIDKMVSAMTFLSSLCNTNAFHSRARVIKVGLKFFLKHFFATICASSGLWSLSARVICSSPITIRCAHTSHRRANASSRALVVVFSSVALVSPCFALDDPRTSRRRLRRDKDGCVSTPRHATRPPPPRTTGFIFVCASVCRYRMCVCAIFLWHHQCNFVFPFPQRELEASNTKMPSKKSALCIHTRVKRRRRRRRRNVAPRRAKRAACRMGVPSPLIIIIIIIRGTR